MLGLSDLLRCHGPDFHDGILDFLLVVHYENAAFPTGSIDRIVILQIGIISRKPEMSAMHIHPLAHRVLRSGFEYIFYGESD